MKKIPKNFSYTIFLGSTVQLLHLGAAQSSEVVRGKEVLFSEVVRGKDVLSSEVVRGEVLQGGIFYRGVGLGLTRTLQRIDVTVVK